MNLSTLLHVVRGGGLRVPWPKYWPVGFAVHDSARRLAVGPECSNVIDTLIVAPGSHCIAGHIFNLTAAGLFRVLAPNGSFTQILVFDRTRVRSCLEGLASIASHGLRDDGLSSKQLAQLALHRHLSLTCHHLARFANWILREVGVLSRIVRILGPPSGADVEEHVIIEVYAAGLGAAASRNTSPCWAAVDLDNKALPYDAVTGSPLTAMTLYQRARHPSTYMVAALGQHAPPTLAVSINDAQTDGYFQPHRVTHVFSGRAAGLLEFYALLYHDKGRPERWEEPVASFRKWGGLRKTPPRELRRALLGEFDGRFAVGSETWRRAVQSTYRRYLARGAISILRGAELDGTGAFREYRPVGEPQAVFMCAPVRCTAHDARVYVHHIREAGQAVSTLRVSTARFCAQHYNTSTVGCPRIHM